MAHVIVKKASSARQKKAVLRLSIPRGADAVHQVAANLRAESRLSKTKPTDLIALDVPLADLESFSR